MTQNLRLIFLTWCGYKTRKCDMTSENAERLKIQLNTAQYSGIGALFFLMPFGMPNK